MYITLSSDLEGTHPGPSGHPSEEGMGEVPLRGGVLRSRGVGSLRPSRLCMASERRFVGMDSTR